MPTLMQQKAFERLVELSGKAKTTKGEVLKGIYSPATAKTPSKVFDAKGFKEISEQWKDALAGLDEKEIIKRWFEWATQSKDKRSAIRCGELILKLKGILEESPTLSIRQSLIDNRDSLVEP